MVATVFLDCAGDNLGHEYRAPSSSEAARRDQSKTPRCGWQKESET